MTLFFKNGNGNGWNKRREKREGREGKKENVLKGGRNNAIS
jgi:hypothetical protein